MQFVLCSWPIAPPRCVFSCAHLFGKEKDNLSSRQNSCRCLLFTFIYASNTVKYECDKFVGIILHLSIQSWNWWLSCILENRICLHIVGYGVRYAISLITQKTLSRKNTERPETLYISHLSNKFHPTLQNGWNYLSMLGLKLNLLSYWTPGA